MPRILSRTFAGSMTTLALALALGGGCLSALAAPAAPPLPKTQLAALVSQRPALVARAQAELLGLRGQFGLGAESGFTPHNPFTNPQGRTVTRFHQTFQGRRVWGGEAIVYVEPEGQVQTLTEGVKPGVVLATSGPGLSAGQAEAIALRDLAPKGALAQAPKVEVVVFPSQFTGGLAVRFDAQKQGMVWDREMSVWAKPPADPYVWAYEVRTILANRQDGHREMCYIVDGTTGAILRKWNDIQSDTPVQGTGASFYRGTVPLSTALAADGTYSLDALDRGTLPQPFVAAQGVTQVGLTLYYGYVDVPTGQLGFIPYTGHQGNTWGDGTIIPFPYDPNLGLTLLDYSASGNEAWLQGALTPQGETSAVDAMYGLSTSWDFYKNVFNRNGIDDLGTSTFGIVHELQQGFNGAFPYNDNAYWSNGYFGMIFGEGSRNVLYPGGMICMTELDITGHELSHGVCFNTADLIYDGYSGGLNEANSDIFGKMIQAYADGGAQGSTVPDFPTADLGNWEIGKHSAPSPLRYMYKPSLDGMSADGVYDGLDEMDVHYSSGPLNHMFFFLSQGASADPANVTYSPFLPSGMTGIGNDKAAHIWYKTLTEHLTSDADYTVARAGAIQSAQELFGVGSAEEVAVMEAFSAINVGLAPGQAPRPYVTLPVINPPGSFFDTNAVPAGILRKVQVFPTRTSVQISAHVLNTSNQTVTFSVPPTWHNQPAGNINADGTWQTPNWQYYMDLLSFQVNSVADPSQFARGNVLLADLDSDQDNQVDAIDLGSTAMAWGYNGQYQMQVPNQKARTGGGGDWDFVFFTQAFTNAFPVK